MGVAGSRRERASAGHHCLVCPRCRREGNSPAACGSVHGAPIGGSDPGRKGHAQPLPLSRQEEPSPGLYQNDPGRGPPDPANTGTHAPQGSPVVTPSWKPSRGSPSTGRRVEEKVQPHRMDGRAVSQGAAKKPRYLELQGSSRAQRDGELSALFAAISQALRMLPGTQQRL